MEQEINPRQWPCDIEQAKKVQDELRERVRLTPLKKAPRLIASVDASFCVDQILGISCLYHYPSLELLEWRYSTLKIQFPYIPGFLSFREGPAVVSALESLSRTPDLILFDGQGIAHPRKLGLASHIGVILDVPSIGCAKSRLVGEYEEPGVRKGDRSDLVYKGEIVGAVVRTKDRVKPMFVSPGHRIDLTDSIDIVIGCSAGYRLPIPLREADIRSKEMKRILFR